MAEYPVLYGRVGSIYIIFFIYFKIMDIMLLILIIMEPSYNHNAVFPRSMVYIPTGNNGKMHTFMLATVRIFFI